jgi:hypothetical protein
MIAQDRRENSHSRQHPRGVAAPERRVALVRASSYQNQALFVAGRFACTHQLLFG